MSEEVYRGLTAKDINNLVSFAIDCDLWGFHTNGEDPETDIWIERVDAANNEIYKEMRKNKVNK